MCALCLRHLLGGSGTGFPALLDTLERLGPIYCAGSVLMQSLGSAFGKLGAEAGGSGPFPAVDSILLQPTATEFSVFGMYTKPPMLPCVTNFLPYLVVIALGFTL